MIRVVAVISLVCLLVMVLYLPSAHPPERFLAQLRTEHEATAAYWGDAPALRILSRALIVQDSARQAAPIPSSADAHLGDFSSSYSTQLSESFEEMVPADVLGKLPNLQYFASVSGGRILKGRFPILDPDRGVTQPQSRSTR